MTPATNPRPGASFGCYHLLNNGEYSHEPPPGRYRAILAALDACAAASSGKNGFESWDVGNADRMMASASVLDDGIAVTFVGASRV